MRDASGKEVPLTDKGRNWLAGHGLTAERALPAPARLSVSWSRCKRYLRSRRVRSIRCSWSCREPKPDDPAWVASPVQIRVPEPEVAGVNRPPYGSARMWERLATMAQTPRTDMVLQTTIRPQEDAIYLMMNLENLTKDVIRLDVGRGEREIVLVRDKNGTCLPTNENAREIIPSWWFMGGPDVLFPRRFVATDQHPHSSVANASYPLQMVFPLRRGATYTVLTAVNLTLGDDFIKRPYHSVDFADAKDFSALTVAKPVTFTVPGIESDATNTKMASASVAPSASPTPPLTFDEQWKESIRFAGKPFEGLLLAASVGKPSELTITLHNRSSKSILVKKWKGESDYEILIRDPAGKPVPLTEKGKMFFQSGNLLDIRALKPGEAVHATLPLSEFFAMQAPGDYS